MATPLTSPCESWAKQYNYCLEGVMDTDERIGAIAQSVELIASMQQETERKVTALLDTVAKHEQRWERVRRVVLAALQAGLADNGEGESE